MKTIFTARRLFTPVEEIQNASLVVEEGRISEIRSRGDSQLPSNAHLVDLGENIVTPGFLDIHMHGGAGVDVGKLAHINGAFLVAFATPSQPYRLTTQDAGGEFQPLATRVPETSITEVLWGPRTASRAP